MIAGSPDGNDMPAVVASGDGSERGFAPKVWSGDFRVFARAEVSICSGAEFDRLGEQGPVCRSRCSQRRSKSGTALVAILEKTGRRPPK